jgi:hypothetical protein
MKQINILIISILIFISCEKTIKMDIADKGRKMVVNSIFAADSLLKIQLFESKYILDGSYDYPPLENHSIALFENQTEIETVGSNEFGEYQFTSKLTERNTYSIAIYSPKYGDIAAKSYIPAKTKIDKIEYSTKITGEYGYEYVDNIKFKVTFTNEKNIENFYLIKIFYYTENYEYDPDTGEIISTTYSKYYLPLTSEDPSIYSTYSISGLVFSDELFDGQQHTVSCEPDFFNYNSVSPYYSIELITLSKDLFNYYRSYAQYEETNDNPFAEPVKVYNNIENGFGIFGGYSVAIDSVEVMLTF